MKVGFIGSGKMAEALIKALLKSNITEIISSDKNEERLNILNKLNIKTTHDNNQVVKESDIVFITVKPQAIEEVLTDLNITNNPLFVSIAAGITLNKLQLLLPDKRIIRVMPNTPCLVQEMAAGFSLGELATEEDKINIEKILNSAGIAFQVEEEQLDAITALSGSGPAFFAYIIKVMKDYATTLGLQENLALKLVQQTCLGTAKVMKENNISPEKLIEMISSPNGTTVAGLEKLRQANQPIKETIQAAYDRSKELGN